MGGVVLLLGLLAAAAVVTIGVRGPRDVRRQAIHPDRLITLHLMEADYVDNYLVDLPPDSRVTIDEVDAVAVQKGTLVSRTDSEIVYRGRAPGLSFLVSYAIGADPLPNLSFTTVVHHQTWVGRAYFLFVRPMHRLGLPWLTRGMARKVAAPHDRSAESQ